VERLLEPELLDDDHQARTYAQADFSTSNLWFVDQLLTNGPGALQHIIDLGCGPADAEVAAADVLGAARGFASSIKATKNPVIS